MSRSIFRQAFAIRPSDSYDDTLNDAGHIGVALETGSASLEGDLNSIRSQVKMLIGTTNWWDPVSGRDLKEVDDQLAELEAQTLCYRTQVLTDVAAVPAGKNYVLLSGAEKPTLAVAMGAAALGAVCAGSGLAAGVAFDAHELVEIAGANAIQPKNLVMVRDASTGLQITSPEGGYDAQGNPIGKMLDVYGLLQVEADAVDGDAFGDATKRAKISFVRMNAALDDLELCPAADIQGKSINYSYVRRINLDALPEEAFLGDAAFVDQVGQVDITLDRALDNQGTTPATQSTDLEWQIADTKGIDFTGPGGTDSLFAIQSAALRTDAVVDIGAGVFNCHSEDAQFDYGLAVDFLSAAPINIGDVDGVEGAAGRIETTAGDLKLRGFAELQLTDGYRAGSTWSLGDGISLADSSADWSDFEAEFGEVSLLRAITAAQTAQSRVPTVATVTTAVAADANMNPATHLSGALQDYSSIAANFDSKVEVYVNGQRMSRGVGEDVYAGTSPAAGDLKFTFPLRVGDKVEMITWGIV